VMYRAVRQWAGAAAGLLAALLLAVTPIGASVFGHSMEDGALIACLVLAADAWQRAALTGRLRPLVASGVWVGLGFQAKMLQAWLILPALFLGYLCAAPSGSGTRLVTRLWQLAVAGVVMLAVSLSWIAAFTLTPAADRPYVDGSTNNSAFAMVFGYNGLERFGISFPGAVSSGPGIGAGSGSGAAGPGGLTPPGFGQPGGWLKLLSGAYGPQAGWLYPLAVLALLAGLYLTVRARRADPARAGLVMWGTWLVTVAVVFSAMGTLPHTAYLATLAPPVAALSAAGVLILVRLYRAGHPGGRLLAAAVLAEAGWAALTWRSYLGFLSWVLVGAVVAGIAAAIIVAAARPDRQFQPPDARLSRVAVAGLLIGVTAILAAPAAWSASVLEAGYAGTSFDATAGPPEGHGLFTDLRGDFLGDAFGSTQTLTMQTQAIADYATAHGAGAAYLLAVPSWVQASRFILATGREAMPLGGFSGTVNTPTLSRVQDLVRGGKLRFFYFGWFGGPGLGGADLSAGTVGAIVAWVQGTCAKVPADAYGNPVDDFGGVLGGPALYECHRISSIRRVIGS
jgi:4-amino-4-deoxy-L-arabinose transferase-like glycosyltransferase